MNSKTHSYGAARALLSTVLDRIAALYQLRIIDSDERDALANFAQVGFRTGYAELSAHLSRSSNEDPLYQELKKIIAFG